MSTPSSGVDDPILSLSSTDDGDPVLSVSGVDDGVVVTVGDATVTLDRADAAALRAAVGEAVAGRRTFLRTAREHRADGTYAVFRRGADEPAKVFDDRASLAALYERLPERFDATAVAAHAAGEVSGSRRHLLVRHLAEHPAFDCALVCRNPLTAEKKP